MNDRVLERATEQEGEILAQFGEARLVRIDGKLHLRGGSMADRIEALDWAALFMPGEVVSMHR